MNHKLIHSQPYTSNNVYQLIGMSIDCHARLPLYCLGLCHWLRSIQNFDYAQLRAGLLASLTVEPLLFTSKLGMVYFYHYLLSFSMQWHKRIWDIACEWEEVMLIYDRKLI